MCFVYSVSSVGAGATSGLFIARPANTTTPVPKTIAAGLNLLRVSSPVCGRFPFGKLEEVVTTGGWVVEVAPVGVLVDVVEPATVLVVVEEAGTLVDELVVEDAYVFGVVSSTSVSCV